MQCGAVVKDWSCGGAMYHIVVSIVRNESNV